MLNASAPDSPRRVSICVRVFLTWKLCANQAKPSSAPKGSVRPELLFTTMRENGGSNMPVALPEPDGEREGIPLWLCPNCDQLKPLQDYGWKKRNDICPGQQVWFKQGWCNRCLQALVKSVEVS